MLDTRLPVPRAGRACTSSRRIRLSDMDARGRLRLDAIARFLQDAAIDDVQETGWGLPEHLWFVRRIRLDVLRPFLADREVELTTWCSGVAAIAAGRRWSVAGDAGGRVEVDSVWIHLDAAAGPARIEDFGAYAEAAAGRRVSTRLELPDPPPGAVGIPWALRATDVDLHGHVNNAVHWQAVEQLAPSLGIDLRRPLRLELEYRQPLDAGERIDLVAFAEGGCTAVAFVAGGTAVRAVASLGDPPPEVAGTAARGRTSAADPGAAAAAPRHGEERQMSERRHFTTEEARAVGEEIGIDWRSSPFDADELRAGMDVELEHGSHDPDTDVTGDDPHVTARIARAHLNEFPDYYARLERMEEEARRDWAARRGGG